jgi:hypothetical protein
MFDVFESTAAEPKKMHDGNQNTDFPNYQYHCTNSGSLGSIIQCIQSY